MLNEQMQNEEFRKEYEAIQPEMDVIRAIVEARISQNLTQKELSERSGINQADISKIENGIRNPSLNLLKRLADGMGMSLKQNLFLNSRHSKLQQSERIQGYIKRSKKLFIVHDHYSIPPNIDCFIVVSIL